MKIINVFDIIFIFHYKKATKLRITKNHPFSHLQNYWYFVKISGVYFYKII